MNDKNKRRLQYLISEAGERVSVVLPVEEYEAILEDIADLAAVAERRDEETIDHAAVVARLKGDGLL